MRTEMGMIVCTKEQIAYAIIFSYDAAKTAHEISIFWEKNLLFPFDHVLYQKIRPQSISEKRQPSQRVDRCKAQFRHWHDVSATQCYCHPEASSEHGRFHPRL
jgi:hypothetical protein